MATGELQFRKSIGDFSRAIEQGRAAVYRRNFESRTYEYIGRYIKEITGYDQTELTPELWDSLILHTEQKGELQHLELAEANRLVRSGQVDRWQADVAIRTRSGEIRWVTDMWKLYWISVGLEDLPKPIWSGMITRKPRPVSSFAVRSQ